MCRHPPVEHTHPPYWSVAQWTSCRSFPDSKVLWKLRARQSSSSSTRLLTRPNQALPSANESPTRPACMPLSQRSSRRSILARIYLVLRVPSVLVNTTWANTRGLSEFYFWSSTPCHSIVKTALNRRPTFPGGVEYQLSDYAASRLKRLCHVASYGTPPARCVPLLW